MKKFMSIFLLADVLSFPLSPSLQGSEGCEQKSHAVKALAHAFAMVGECKYPKEIERDLRRLFSMAEICEQKGLICDAASTAVVSYLADRVPKKYGCKLNLARILGKKGFSKLCEWATGGF